MSISTSAVIGAPEEQPWAESSPSGVGLIGKCADDGVVDGVPESGNKHQGCYGTHADSEHIGVENHEEVAHEHPTEVAAHIAHAIGELTDEGTFPVDDSLASCSFVKHSLAYCQLANCLLEI